MKALELVRKIYLWEELPGHGMLLNGKELYDLAIEKMPDFVWIGKSYNDDQIFVLITDSRMCKMMGLIYGDIYATCKYDDTFHFVFEITE